MLDIRTALHRLATQRYGPLYVVRSSNPLETTAHVFLLDPGQTLEIERNALPNVRHSDLRDGQEIFGRVPGPTRWSSDEYTWKATHPSVKDGTVQQWVEQLLAADQTGIELGMLDYWTRQLWLANWATTNLGKADFSLPLPDLDLEP